MKKEEYFITMLTMLCIFFNTFCFAQNRTIIAVLNITVCKDISVSGASSLSNIINDELIKSSQYIVVDRRNVQVLLEEMKLQLSGVTIQEKIVEVGKILNVQKLVMGNIGKLGQKYIIDLQLIDVKTGKIDNSIVQSYIGTIEGLENPVAFTTRQLISLEITMKKGTFIYANSVPAGAKIYVNNDFRGNSPVKIEVDDANEYTIKASTSGYEDWIQTVWVKKDEMVFINAILAEEKGYRFIIKRDGPLLLGVGSGIAATVFRVKANSYYQDQKTSNNLEEWRRAKDDTERNDKISYLFSGISAVSIGYYIYGFLVEDNFEVPEKSYSFKFFGAEGNLLSLTVRF